MPLIRTRVLLIGPRKRRQSIRHWDLVKDLIEQDRQMGQDPVAVVKPPWPLIPPFELGTIEQEWLRYRNVQKLVASGAIQPPRWFKESRLAPPNSGPFWGDPPVHGMDHKLPLRRHIWTHNLKPPTELMKMFLLRKEDRVYEKNFRQVIGFTPQEKVRRGLKENIPNAAREGRTTFNFFWQKKSLEKVETRYSQLVDEGVAEVEANRIVEREFQTAVAVRKRQQAFAAETARRSGKAVSAFQGHWVLDLIATLQEHAINRALTDSAGNDLRVVAAHHTPEVRHGKRIESEEDEDDTVSKETIRYLEYAGLQPDMLSFEEQIIGQHRPMADPETARKLEAEDAIGGGQSPEEVVNDQAKDRPSE